MWLRFVVCYYLWFVTICGARLCGLLLFCVTICGLLLFVVTICGHDLWFVTILLLFVITICGHNLWLWFAVMICDLLLFVVMICCLLLFVVTICCARPRSSTLKSSVSFRKAELKYYNKQGQALLNQVFPFGKPN